MPFPAAAAMQPASGFTWADLGQAIRAWVIASSCYDDGHVIYEMQTGRRLRGARSAVVRQTKWKSEACRSATLTPVSSIELINHCCF